MDVAQLANGTAALVAIAASHYAFVKLGYATRIGVVVHFVHVVILAWYAVINLLLSFGLWVPEVSEIIPLFRYAFAPLLITYALRQWLAGRRVETMP